METKTRTRIIRILNTLLPVLFALALGAVAILMVDQNPLKVYASIVRSAFFSKNGFLNTLIFATPLIMTGLCLVVAFGGGVFNLGGEGQLYLGAFFATYLGFTLEGLPPWLHVLICLLGGVVAGALFALIPGILKAYFRINELVSTIMLNYIALIFCNYLTNGPFAYSYQYSSTQPVLESAQLPKLVAGHKLSAGILVALVVFLFVWVLVKRTRFGYELRAMGQQKEFADAMGMRVNRKIVQIFLISGGIAGLAGAVEILGVHQRFTPSFSTNPGLGWDGMLVALLGNNKPLGTLIAGILFGAFKFGGVSLQIKFGIPSEVINIIQSSLILFLSVKFLNEKSGFLTKAFRKKQPQAEEA